MKQEDLEKYSEYQLDLKIGLLHKETKNGYCEETVPSKVVDQILEILDNAELAFRDGESWGESHTKIKKS